MQTLASPLRQGLTQQEAARELGTTTRTLQRWHKAGFGPRPMRDGVCALYDPAALAAFKAGARS
jgi:hypothetical protein